MKQGEPYVHHVPMMTGGIGYDSVYNFYKNHFVGKMPDDTKLSRISGSQQDLEDFSPLIDKA
jgi:hypothetical protein